MMFNFHYFQNKTAPPAVILFSIIALEKFAQTTENKITIQKRLQEASTSLDNLHNTSDNNHIDGENNQLNSIYTLPKGNRSFIFTIFLYLLIKAWQILGMKLSFPLHSSTGKLCLHASKPLARWPKLCSLKLQKTYFTKAFKPCRKQHCKNANV